MTKRFTATEKWKRPWFRGLSPEYKSFWFYILDNCDKIGIWYVDYDLASFNVGAKIEPEKAMPLFSKQVLKLDGGTRWFIKDFVTFQYGKLKPNNPLHRSVFLSLEGLGLTEFVAPTQGLPSPCPGDKEEEEEEDKEKKEEKEYKIRTPGQQVLAAYKLLTGIEIQDRAWDRMYYSRYKKNAEELLVYFGGEVETVIRCIEGIKKWAEGKSLDWNLGTVVKRASDWKTKRLYGDRA